MENFHLPLPGEVYIHFKGGVYRVLHLAKHTETEEILVVYKLISPGDKGIWARPLVSWGSLAVTEAGEKVPRFTKINKGAFNPMLLVDVPQFPKIDTRSKFQKLIDLIRGKE